MEDNGQLQLFFRLTTGKQNQLNSGQGAGWPTASSESFGQRKIQNRKKVYKFQNRPLTKCPNCAVQFSANLLV